MLRLEGIAKQIQGQTLFESVDLTLQAGDRLGVIGVNGCGKSTFLKVVAGLVEPDRGSIWLAEGYRVGYLPGSPGGRSPYGGRCRVSVSIRGP